MEPHSRRWHSSGIIVFRVKCKNGGRSLQIRYSKCVIMGTAVAQWLKCHATNWKVTGLIPAGVIGFFIDIKSSDRTMALGSTQPLTEMSTRIISWG